jgi:hypothetical protein
MGSHSDAGAGGISVTVTTPNCDAGAMHSNGEAGSGTAASVNGLDKIKVLALLVQKYLLTSTKGHTLTSGCLG